MGMEGSVGEEKLTPEVRMEETVSTKKSRKYSGYLLGAFYCQLHMEIIDKNWVMTTIKDFGNNEGQIDRYFCGNIYLLRVIFLSIVFITFYFSIEPYYLTLLHSFIGFDFD